ncbi:LuxR family transcriptional regulator [Leifsonia xyli subsp. cynodontis DSM 46306]|uniref:HTH luxR-type domain-containing protein n=1 Tax=Leifsonia xyli subsp. cynodontis DSM 46306 TaxID=1389489 RepID=U3PAM8_LEIXC|nr:LuxR C-terminal-related transcriptional regulator [Leifsonia xyli]AGW40543.1 LuxR family transcriptional regulator [Leifsonia xyli subsp. cynodontis DSM 46306]
MDAELMAPRPLPRRPVHFLPRPRLTERLDAAAPLVVVRAPAGSGKTVLLADWCARRRSAGDTVLWVTLTAGSAHADRAADQLWAAVAAQLGAPAISPADAFDAVRLALAGTAGPPVRLTLDGYCPARAPADPDIARLLETCPRVQVAIGTRALTSFEDVAAAASLDVECLGPDDLLFTAEESARLVDAIAGEDRPPRPSVLAWEEGERVLPLTARLTGVGIRRGFDPYAVAEALLRRQLGEQPCPELTRFLRVISSVSPCDSELARRLTGLDSPDPLFRAAEEQGLGTWRGDWPRRQFVLDPAAAVALARQHTGAEPREATRSLRVVCSWALETGDHVRALHAAVAAREPLLVSRVAREAWEPLSTISAAATVDLLERLGGEALERFPVVAVLYALALSTREQHERAVHWFALAARTLSRRGRDDDPGERLLVLCAESASFRLGGDTAASLRVAEEGMLTVAGLARSRDAAVPRIAELCAQLAITFHWGSWSERALEACALGVALGSTEHPQDRRHCVAVRAFVLAFRGDIVAARSALSALGPRTEDPTSSASLFDALARSLVLIEDGEPEAAERMAVRAAAMPRAPEHWAAVLHCRATALLFGGRPERCAAAIDVALAARGSRPASQEVLDRLAITRVLALLAAGDRTAADTALRDLFRAGCAPIGVRALHSLLAGKGVAAISEPDGAARTAGETSSPDDVLHALVVAAALLACGENADAAGAARRAVAAATERGLRTPLALLPAVARLALLTAGGGDPEAEWPFALRMPAVEHPAVRLTQKEVLVLHRLGSAATLADIAQEFSVSVNTVKTQTRSLYRKLRVRSRDAALIRAAELGLMERLTE